MLGSSCFSNGDGGGGVAPDVEGCDLTVDATKAVRHWCRGWSCV